MFLTTLFIFSIVLLYPSMSYFEKYVRLVGHLAYVRHKKWITSDVNHEQILLNIKIIQFLCKETFVNGTFINKVLAKCYLRRL